jgi:hypothetical protein
MRLGADDRATVHLGVVAAVRVHRIPFAPETI